MLLLTGTIAPMGSQKDKIQSRLQQYIANILDIITNSNSQKISFCDNSNYKLFDFDAMNKIAQAYNKEFEYLSFDGNHEKSQTFGRGYGDQEIIEYFVKNSKILFEKDSFYKLTGRYRLLNINQILASTQNHKNIFMRMGPNDKRISTAFFKVDKKYFGEKFVGCKDLVDDSKGVDCQLEGIYTNIINKSQNISNFPILPLFSGTTGSGYNLHDTTIRRLVKQILFNLGFYNAK